MNLYSLLHKKLGGLETDCHVEAESAPRIRSLTRAYAVAQSILIFFAQDAGMRPVYDYENLCGRHTCRLHRIPFPGILPSGTARAARNENTVMG